MLEQNYDCLNRTFGDHWSGDLSGIEDEMHNVTSAFQFVLKAEISETLEGLVVEGKLSTKVIDKLRYADNTVYIASSEQGM